MSNMSYCRFENTYADLEDCFDHMGEDVSESEKDYKQRMIKLCEQIARRYGDEEE